MPLEMHGCPEAITTMGTGNDVSVVIQSRRYQARGRVTANVTATPTTLLLPAARCSISHAALHAQISVPAHGSMMGCGNS